MARQRGARQLACRRALGSRRQRAPRALADARACAAPRAPPHHIWHTPMVGRVSVMAASLAAASSSAGTSSAYAARLAIHSSAVCARACARGGAASTPRGARARAGCAARARAAPPPRGVRPRGAASRAARLLWVLALREEALDVGRQRGDHLLVRGVARVRDPAAARRAHA